MSIHEMVQTQKWYYICHMRSAYFPINRRLHRERAREREREKPYPSVKQCKHRNSTISVIWDMHISLSIGDCIEREREAISIHKTMQTQKQYYLHNMRSAYFPINRRLCRESVQEGERLYSSVKLWKHRNSTISIIQDLHISLSIADCMERERERERERGYVHLWNGENMETVLSPWYKICIIPLRETERLCPLVNWWKHRNGTISIIWHLDISP